MKAASLYTLAASSCLYSLILASCSPLDRPFEESAFGAMGRHELRVLLPAAPEAWAQLPDLMMAVAWRDPGGRLRSALGAPGSELRVEVERGRPQAILALPSSGGQSLMPAGALYPEALAAPGAERFVDALVLDWLGGYAASVSLALSGGGVDPWGYDLSRLAAEAWTRCGDPWLLPALEAARALACLEFRIDAYGEPRRMDVSLPGPGPWSPESPFEAAPEGPSRIARLPEGLWRFLGPGEELLVSVDAEGRAAFVRR